MTYNPNIPVVTDPILLSQRQIKANFQTINQAFSDNHTGLQTSDEFAGMHNLLTLRPQTGDPATSSDQIAIYNKLVSSIPQLFFRPNSSQTPIQMTISSIKVDSSNTQHSFVAGPFVVHFGFISPATNGQVVNLTPATSLIYVDLTVANAVISPTSLAIAIATNVVGNSFTITTQTFAPGTTFDIYYIAIGTP